jgi:hypothetical protein
MCPIVPMFTCGLLRSNFSFAIFLISRVNEILRPCWERERGRVQKHPPLRITCRSARPISRFLSPQKRVAIIPLGLPLRKGSSDLPGSSSEAGHFSSPIWSCFAWGLPCQRDYSRRGALLPHLFTLTCSANTCRRYVFCGTFRSFGF